MKFIGAIDVGSNAIRASVAKIKQNNYEIVYKERFAFRLGGDVFSEGKVSKEKFELGLDVFSIISHSFDAYRLKSISAVGTSALRNAKNKHEFLNEVKESSGIRVKVISGKVESDLIFKAVSSVCDLSKEKSLIMDLGGGSLELIALSKGKVIKTESFKIGTLRYLKLKEKSKKKLKKYFNKMEDQIIDFFEECFDKDGKEFSQLIATGGNARRMGKLRFEYLSKNLSTIIKRSEMRYFYKELKDLTVEQRVLEYGLREDRADVLVPALKIFHTVSKLARVKEIEVPKIGLIDGLFLDQIKD